jgi:predicted neuraminidase
MHPRNSYFGMIHLRQLQHANNTTSLLFRDKKKNNTVFISLIRGSRASERERILLEKTASHARARAFAAPSGICLSNSERDALSCRSQAAVQKRLSAVASLAVALRFGNRILLCCDLRTP